jgi:hypothetical protein
MNTLYYTDPTGKQYEVEQPDPPLSPLDAVGALATLLAVEEVLSVEDAANAVGLTPEDLVNEALAWGATNP